MTTILLIDLIVKLFTLAVVICWIRKDKPIPHEKKGKYTTALEKHFRG